MKTVKMSAVYVPELVQYEPNNLNRVVGRWYSIYDHVVCIMCLKYSEVVCNHVSQPHKFAPCVLRLNYWQNWCHSLSFSFLLRWLLYKWVWWWWGECKDNVNFELQTHMTEATLAQPVVQWHCTRSQCAYAYTVHPTKLQHISACVSEILNNVCSRIIKSSMKIFSHIIYSIFHTPSPPVPALKTASSFPLTATFLLVDWLQLLQEMWFPFPLTNVIMIWT